MTHLLALASAALLVGCCHNPVVSQPAAYKVGALADPCADSLPLLAPEQNASETGFLEWAGEAASLYGKCRDSKASLVKVLRDNKVIEAPKP